MTNEINPKRIYQFLANYNSGDQTWVDVVDGYGRGKDDGVVIKSEFTDFINDNFNWNGETDAQKKDLIDDFWETIDENVSATHISGTKLKNLNALDEKEQDKMNNSVTGYVILNETISSIQAPKELLTTKSQWKTFVAEALSKVVDKWLDDGAKGDVKAKIEAALPAAKNEATARCTVLEYQNSLKSTILKDYPNYNIAEDETLNALIDKYIENLDPNKEIDTATIINEIKAIIDAYLATVGLSDNKNDDLLNGLGFEQNSISDLQKQVVLKGLQDQLKDTINSDQYKGYKNEILGLLESFVDSKIEEGYTFEELQQLTGTQFIEEGWLTRLDTTISVLNTYGKIDASSPVYEQLKTSYSEDLVKLIAENAKYQAKDFYEAILNTVIDKVCNGELTTDEITEYITNEINKNITKFLPETLKNQSVPDLNNTYDELANNADEQEQQDTELGYTLHRDSARLYLNSLANLDPEYARLISDTLGSRSLEDMYPNEIKELLGIIKEKALELDKIKNMKVSSWGGNVGDVESIDLGTSKSFNINATIEYEGEAIEVDSYQAVVKSGSGSAEILNNGALTITAGNKVEKMTVEVYAIVDGRKVGNPKVITIKCNESAATIANRVTDWGEQSSEDLFSIGYNHNTTLTKNNFADLYNNDVMIGILHADVKQDKSWSEHKNKVKGPLEQLGSIVLNALVSAGLIRDKLETAIDNVIDKYFNNGPILNTTRDSDYENRYSLANYVGEKYKNDLNTRHSLFGTLNKAGTNEVLYAIHFKDFVDDIIAEYNKLI